LAAFCRAREAGGRNDRGMAMSNLPQIDFGG
jgi:hypothetical protein